MTEKVFLFKPMFHRLLIIFIVIGMTVIYSVYQKRSFESTLVGGKKSESVLKRLPQSSFQTLEGNPFPLHEIFTDKETKLVIVHFWGTWCAPCEAELPDLLMFMKRFEDRPGVKFLLVAANDDAKKVKKHIKALPVPSHGSVFWLLDNNNVHRNDFGTTRVPETFVFAADKTTLRKFVGPQEWNKTMFFQTFDEFLQISQHKL